MFLVPGLPACGSAGWHKKLICEKMLNMHSSTKYKAIWTKLHVLVFHAAVAHFTSSAVRDAPLQYGRVPVRSPMYIKVGSVCIGHRVLRRVTRNSAQIPTCSVFVIAILSCENLFAAITFYACGPSVNSFRKSRRSGCTHFNYFFSLRPLDLFLTQ